MPPIDPTPDAGEVMHQPSQPPYPEPKPGSTEAVDQSGDRTGRGTGAAGEERTDPVTGAGEDIAG